jgi:hypothetical protein
LTLIGDVAAPFNLLLDAEFNGALLESCDVFGSAGSEYEKGRPYAVALEQAKRIDQILMPLPRAYLPHDPQS